MREIKFRAWAPVTNHMYSHEELLESTLGDISRPPEGVVYQQYTGQHDMTGKEVYEGDVFQGGISRFFVSWDNPTGCYVARNAMTELEIRDWRKKFEVIGNIYENPELLTK